MRLTNVVRAAPVAPPSDFGNAYVCVRDSREAPIVSDRSTVGPPTSTSTGTFRIERGGSVNSTDESVPTAAMRTADTVFAVAFTTTTPAGRNGTPSASGSVASSGER